MRNSLIASVFVGLLALPGLSQALTISPDDAQWMDLSPITNNTPQALAEASALCSCSLINSGPNSNKMFETGGGENPDQTINPPVGFQYLFVKDGAHLPAWYLFDLSALGWTGPGESIELENFWPGAGAISHISGYGTFQPPTGVPEPATLSMLALGLAAVGVARRRAQGNLA